MEIEKKLILTEKELFIDLGKELNKGFGFSEKSNDDLEEEGKNWFDENIIFIKSNICDSITIHYYESDPSKWDKVLLIAAIADLISSVCINISPITVAVMIFKEGINKICGGKVK